MSIVLPFSRDFDCEYGVADAVAPGLRRIVANNPSPFTFKGTNSYIVGTGMVAVIDPGPDDEAHRCRPARGVGARRRACVPHFPDPYP